MPVRGRKQPWLVVPDFEPGTQDVVALAILRNAPYQMIILRASPRGGTYRLTDFQALVVH